MIARTTGLEAVAACFRQESTFSRLFIAVLTAGSLLPFFLSLLPFFLSLVPAIPPGQAFPGIEGIHRLPFWLLAEY